MDEEGDGDKDQKAPPLLRPLVLGARQDVSTAGRAAHPATTVAQGVGLKNMDTRMRQQQITKCTAPRTHLEDEPIAIVKLITNS